MAKPVQSLLAKLRQTLGLGGKGQGTIKKSSARPWIELLEDRCVPTGGFGTIQGTAFIDANGNGIFDAKDAKVAGVKLTLVGTTAGANVMEGNTAINVTVTSNAQGVYKFQNVPEGSYKLQTATVPGLTGGKAQTHTGLVIATNGQILKKDIRFVGGVTSTSYSSRQLLTNTSQQSFPYGPAGTGGSTVNFAPTALAIPTQSIPTGSTDKVLDLAAFFRDANFTNSQVTFHITNGTTTSTIKMTLFDTTAPSTVTNFFNYVVGNVYDDTVFHRLTNKTDDGIGVLQGGGFEVELDGAGPGTKLKGIDEIPPGSGVTNEFNPNRLNLAGTLALAQSGGPSTGSSQFFFNTINNPSLDAQAFAVFAKVADTASLNALKALTTVTKTDFTTTPFDATTSELINDFPTPGYTADKNGFPSNATLANYVRITDITVDKRDEFLTYALVGTNGGADELIAKGTLTNEFLTLHSVAAGNTEFEIKVTDRYGASITKKVKVSITGNDAPTLDLNGATAGNDVTVAFTEGAPQPIAPTGTISDPDHTTLNKLTATLNGGVFPDGSGVESLSLNTAAQAAAVGLTVNYVPATGVLTITGTAPITTYQTILQGIQYNNTSANPTTTNRTVAVVANDGLANSATRTSTITLTNVPSVSVAVTDSPADEATGALTFTFTRDFVTASALTVNFSVGGNATSGDDFTALTGTVVIPANQASGVVTVTPTNDTLLEAAETVALTVTAGAGYLVGGTPTATGTIDDNESATVAIAPTASVDEDGGAQPVGVTLTITGSGTGTFALGAGITLSAEVIDLLSGTAVSGTDYGSFGTQTVTYNPADATGTVKNVLLTPSNNGTADGNKTVALKLQNLVKGATVDAVLGNVDNETTILDDEP